MQTIYEIQGDVTPEEEHVLSFLRGNGDDAVIEELERRDAESRRSNLKNRDEGTAIPSHEASLSSRAGWLHSEMDKAFLDGLGGSLPLLSKRML